MLFALALFVLNVGMNVILSIFMVETELLIGFDKPMKKNCIVSFYKRIEILTYNNFELSSWEKIIRFLE